MAAARGSCPLCASRSGKGGQEEGRGHGAGGGGPVLRSRAHVPSKGPMETCQNAGPLRPDHPILPKKAPNSDVNVKFPDI